MANLQEDEWLSWLSNYSTSKLPRQQQQKNVLTHAHMLTTGMCTAGVKKKKKKNYIHLVCLCVCVCVRACVYVQVLYNGCKACVCCTTDVHIFRFLAF